MTPTGAIAVIRQLPPCISATPAVHAQIQLAIATLDSLAKSAEAKAQPTPPAKIARKRR
jgi:hypothetical protein